MSVQRVNFEPMTDILKVHRRDFPLADPTLSIPMNTAALVDGEWMVIDANYKLARAVVITAAGNAAATLSFPLFAERGRYDVQATSQKKMPILFFGGYGFDTRIFDATAVVGSGAAITTALQPLKVASVDIDSVIYSGLVGHGGAADTDPIVGYVTRLPASNNGKLRFVSGGRH